MTVKELRAQRAKLVADARKLVDLAGVEKRSMSAEENTTFDTMMGDADKLEERISGLEKLEAKEKDLAESRGRQTDPPEPGRQPGGSEAKVERRATEEYRSMYDTFLRGGFSSFGPAEARALSAENDVQGGYLAAPMQTVAELIKFVDNNVVIRQLATVVQVPTAQALGAASLDADPADAAWTAEIATGNEDSTMAFGRRELHPQPLAKRIKLSNKLLRLVPSAEGLVRYRLAYKFAVTQEAAFMTGTGANQPLGVFTASTSGISTGRDVSTDNTTTAITGDGLINAKYSLKEAYLRSPALRWVFHRDAVKQIRKLKDGNGQYLWLPGLQQGQPDRVLDVPVIMSEYAPNTFTTGLYVGMIGDFSKYWIADAMSLAIQRLVELYAETNQVGFIGRLEVDGMPVLEEAFARVKLA
jgi:HK97 family phage major capsid protein